ncbi:MAG: two-component sensor histidine kinase [Planctomycetes bacterium]|nr:two-component sensor histidine kinase [Planctomycetota bacterium]
MNEPYAALAESAGGFIHEIKNHLSTLGLNLQLLAEDFHDPQSHRERRALARVQKLQGECQRLVDVANDFLRFARIQELDRRPADIGKIIEEMIDFFSPTARTANIEIKSFVAGDLPLIPLDRDLFKQALLNLMLNAEQAMPSGGELTIQATHEPGEKRQGSEDGNHKSLVCLSLIDTGKGMPAGVLARVFEPFFSTRPGGTGLGLPTTRKIIDAHGGDIEVQSEVGRGTKFTIRLPVN